MSVVLDCDTEDSETVHLDSIVLHPGLVFENMVNRLREQTYKGVALGGSDEYTGQL